MLGVKTVGNATLIAYEDTPILATDPWLGDEDEAYFGSWRLSHQIPAVERSDILSARYIWFSHGHPDHLNPRSVRRFRHASILLPDHVGGRIRNDLEGEGYNVTVLPDARWVELSKRIKVSCLSDYIQDAVLLVDVGGRLFINMNDCTGLARLNQIRSIARSYRNSYLLRLSGYGDADMINLFDLEGNRIETPRYPVGQWLSTYAQRIGATAVIPFSSFHQYQRSDSIWANARTTPLAAYREGFDERKAEFIEPFVWIDATSGSSTPLNPPELSIHVREPEDFGDNWSDELARDDRRSIDEYFQRKELLYNLIGFIEFLVGGKRHIVDFKGPKDVGISFAVPRNSLMLAIRYRIFDDLLIGNFMRTTLHSMASLYAPNFTFIVTKYGDNGGVQTDEDLKRYLAQYRKRSGGTDWLVHRLVQDAKSIAPRLIRIGGGPVYGVVRLLRGSRGGQSCLATDLGL